MNEFRAAQYRSVVEPIHEQLKTEPGRTALIFVGDDEAEELITVRQLHAGACSYAQSIRELGLKPGDIVILALRHCQELIFAFWGSLYAGVVPTIIGYKGPMTTSAAYMGRLKEMASRSGARLIITLPALEATVKSALAATDCRVLSMAASGTDRTPGDFSMGEAIAYLQFTSGTTGMQKGVRLSHRAILNQIQSLSKCLRLNQKDVVVNWLPLYHDFGLFAGFIMPLLCAIPGILLSPFQWLRDPASLLRLIHRHKGTISFISNSALHHTVHSLSGRELGGLDLGSLRFLANGSEPVLYESQQMFLERFAPFGFKESALSTGYGMAEITLAATCSRENERSPVDWVRAKEMQTLRQAVPGRPGETGSKPNVSSGVPMENIQMAIIDEHGHRLSERHIGEIIIRSHSLFSGYHQRNDLTDQALKDGWYHSGDIGYIAEGCLYVCGRKKDLIIVCGHNVHPEDLEAIAGTVSGIQEDRVVALGVMDEALGSERIVMISGLEHPVSDEDKACMERDLRQRIHAGLEVTLGEVYFVKKNWLEKTLNGKIARKANLEKYKKYLAKPADIDPRDPSGES